MEKGFQRYADSMYVQKLAALRKQRYYRFYVNSFWYDLKLKHKVTNGRDWATTPTVVTLVEKLYLLRQWIQSWDGPWMNVWEKPAVVNIESEHSES